MEEKIIEKLLKSTYTLHGKYQDLSVKNLIVMMSYLEEHLKTTKGNWCISNYKNYCKEREIHPIQFTRNLEGFYNQYSKRKKKIITFEKYLSKCKKALNIITLSANTSTSNTNINLRIKNKELTYDFLIDIKKHFETYLTGGSHDDWLKSLQKIIKFDYTSSTLRKKYFEN